MENYYRILEISTNASEEVIKAAYKALSRKYHPDNDSSNSAEEMMKQINYSRDILLDPVQRSRYDRELKEALRQQRNRNSSSYSQERAEREARERAAKEKAERAAKEKAERAAKEKAERAAKEKAERAAKEKAEREAAARNNDETYKQKQNDFNQNRKEYNTGASDSAIDKQQTSKKKQDGLGIKVLVSISLLLLFFWGVSGGLNNVRQSVDQGNDDDITNVDVNSTDSTDAVDFSEFNFVTVGSSKEDVIRIEGEPDRKITVSNIWIYSNSTIGFDENDKVNSWDNSNENLNVYLGSREQDTDFSIGSNPLEVLHAKGTPILFQHPPSVWAFSDITVYFNNGIVSKWDKNEIADTMDDEMPEKSNSIVGTSEKGDKHSDDSVQNDSVPDDSSPTINDTQTVSSLEKEESISLSYITIGSTKDDVVNIMGSPDTIYESLNRWVYQYSSIDFSRRNTVIAWDNTSGNLQVNLGHKVGGVFTIGSSKEEVVAAMGTPDTIYPSLNRWVFQYSSVDFSDTNKVKSWDNSSGNLNVTLGELIPNRTFTINSSKEEVVAAMGTPDTIYPSLNRWVFQYSSVDFSDTNKVKGWDNSSGNLRLK